MSSVNPFDELIQSSTNDPASIQSSYDSHRRSRNESQKTSLLSPDFKGIQVDCTLQRLLSDSSFADPRHCLSLWTRPPAHICDLVRNIQLRLAQLAPGLWLVPRANLHLTVLEAVHSQAAPVIAALVDTLRPYLPAIVEYPRSHRTRLVKPLLSFDSAGVALTFVPDILGDAYSGVGDTSSDRTYTIHHLRRDIFNMVNAANVKPVMRYVAPSAHITIARFISAEDLSTWDAQTQSWIPSPPKLRAWINKIEEINAWLSDEGASVEAEDSASEWIIGAEAGIDPRSGTCWYGGGDRVQ